MDVVVGLNADLWSGSPLFYFARYIAVSGHDMAYVERWKWERMVRRWAWDIYLALAQVWTGVFSLL